MFFGQVPFAEPEVDEARPGDFGAGDEPGRQLERLQQFLRNGARIDPPGPRHHHRQVGCKIAVTSVARALDDELRISRTEPDGRGLQCLPQCVAHSPAFRPGVFEDDAAAVPAGGLAGGLSAPDDAMDVSARDGSTGRLAGPLPSLP